VIECGIASHRIVDSRLAATYACGLRCAAAAAARRRNLLRLSHVAARRPVLQRVAASAAALSRLARAACQVYMRHKNCSRLKPPKATKGVGLTRYEYSAAPGSAAPSATSTLGMVTLPLSRLSVPLTASSVPVSRLSVPSTTICTTLYHLYSRGTRVHRREGFVIRHFAGEVLYSSHGFLDKNTDVLHASLDR
jgi:hypothetical protein